MRGGAWGMLEALVVAVSATVAEKFAEKAAEELVSALLKGQKEQTILLERIDRNVQQLIEGPFYAGEIRLREALAPHRTPQQRDDLITKARDTFYDAYGQERTPLRLSLISLNIGICWLALGSEYDARSWIGQAHNFSKDAAIEVVKVANQRNLDWYLDVMMIGDKRRAPVDRMQEYLLALKELRLSLGEAPRSIPWYSIYRDSKGEDSRSYRFEDDRPIGLR
jgi:hypothetical protein